MASTTANYFYLNREWQIHLCGNVNRVMQLVTYNTQIGRKSMHIDTIEHQKHSCQEINGNEGKQKLWWGWRLIFTYTGAQDTFQEDSDTKHFYDMILEKTQMSSFPNVSPTWQCLTMNLCNKNFKSTILNATIPGINIQYHVIP